MMEDKMFKLSFLASVVLLTASIQTATAVVSVEEPWRVENRGLALSQLSTLSEYTGPDDIEYSYMRLPSKGINPIMSMSELMRTEKMTDEELKGFLTRLNSPAAVLGLVDDEMGNDPKTPSARLNSRVLDLFDEEQGAIKSLNRHAIEFLSHVVVDEFDKNRVVIARLVGDSSNTYLLIQSQLNDEVYLNNVSQFRGYNPNYVALMNIAKHGKNPNTPFLQKFKVSSKSAFENVSPYYDYRTMTFPMYP